jgi:membrane protein implicated in regulation of membrane protease activity
MIKRGWSWQVLLRYALLQLPGLAALVIILLLLRHWINIPTWAVWIFILLWVIKDLILFPFVWHAYDKRSPDVMSGSQGMAVDRLSPSGYVRINGELWHAEMIEGDLAIEKGEVITVRGMRGLTLIVQSDGVRGSRIIH